MGDFDKNITNIILNFISNYFLKKMILKKKQIILLIISGGNENPKYHDIVGKI